MTYTVYPIIHGCTGTAITVVITVNPVPIITANQQIDVCANSVGDAGVALTITTTPNMPGTLFTWPAPGLSPGLTGGSDRTVPSSAQLIDTYNNGGATSITNATYTVLLHHRSVPAKASIKPLWFM